MIEQSQQVLLASIKASLFDVEPSYPENTDWDAVIKEAKSQAVIGLISPVIPVPVEGGAQSKAGYIRILNEQNNLLRLFDQHDIPCVILKGCAAAVYYPKPYLRQMGDVDILVPRSRFDEAAELMDANGFAYYHGKGEDGKLKEGHRHIAYFKNGIEYELHHHFSSEGFNIDDILEKAIARREYKTLNGFKIPVLPETENGLVLLGHMNYHLKEENLGLRQILDWEMYYHTVMNNAQWRSEFEPLARKIGLWKLADNVTKMCEKHLGLSAFTESGIQNQPAEEDVTDELLENLLKYGNFGSKLSSDSSNTDSGKRIRTVTGNIKNMGFFAYCQANGLETWKLSKKYPVLKPFAFIYGFFRFCFRGTTTIIKNGQIKEQVQYLKHRKKQDKELGIRTVERKKNKKKNE